MRAIVCRRHGDPSVLRLEDVSSPPLGGGEVRIAVKAAGVNFADTLLVDGTYQVKPAFPFSPGLEAAGVVREAAPDVRELHVGQRVMAVATYGAFAEELVARASDVLPLPDELDFATAAAFPIVYGTAHLALAHRGRLRAGETLLVLGAAGGVGLAAVEVGKAMGARVIAAARGREKTALALSHGADETIDYEAEDLRERVKALTSGRGVDIVFDPVGSDLFDAALRALAWEGRLLVIGFAGRRIPQAPANLLLIKNISVIGVHWGAYRDRDADRLCQSLATLIEWWRDGRLKPFVSHRLPLAQAAEALALLLARRATGKVVLDVSA